jgi:adenosylmethionine-8-amino-7-oxononanoate aminotransferase
MNGYFITGTDTDVGKTVFSALLCLALQADYFKPIQTGQDSDCDTVATLTGLPPTRIHRPAISLRAPLSPSQAAEREGRVLSISSISLPSTDRPLVVEGAGGALVPIAPGQDMAGLMVRLGLPVIVVARSGLGTLNHTLLTLEGLHLRGLNVAGVALVGEPNAANRRDIERLGRVPVIVELPPLSPLTPQTLLAMAPSVELPAPPEKPDLDAWDKAHVWRPFTQAGTAPAPIRAVRGQGARILTEDGKELLDLVSSWWVNPHGHAHPAIARALARQASVLEQVIFSDFSHEPAARLAHELSAILPGGLSRVFFSDNGSTAVEVALKMAHQYWRNQGRPERARFAAFQGAYHGDTVGAMSVGLSSGYYDGFESLTFQVDFLPYPATWHGDRDVDEKETQALAVLGNYFSIHAGTVAGVIIEPLVQGASGMRMARPGFVKEVANLVRQAGGLVIFDEVMTGFGRTGTMFACEQVGAAPDIICLAKGLTAGFLPMAATIATEAIYQGFLGETFDRALVHGHSFTANPLGCTAALAGLRLFREESTLARIAALEAVHAERLTALNGRPGLAKPRWRGSIGAVELTGGDKGYDAAIGKKLKQHFINRGFFIRPLGEVFYILPPFCLTPGELHSAYDTLEEVLKELDGSR